MIIKPKVLDADKEYKFYECKWYKILTPTDSCYFCEHLTDIWWDYTNGPYMFACDIVGDVGEGLKGNCGQFKEEKN